jgi:hypothetical protein
LRNARLIGEADRGPTSTVGAMALGTGLWLLTLALSGCSSLGGPSAAAPAGVNFSGIWKLDTRLSTDTQAALRQIVPHERGKRHRGSSDSSGSAGGDGDGDGGGGGGGGGRGGGGDRGGGSYGQLRAGGGGETFSMPIDISLQRSLLQGGDYLQIAQRDGEFVVANGDTTHSYVAGERSVVSVPNGVADRSCGWKGKEYWIELHPEFGPSVSEKFRLEDGGKRLVETIEVAGEGRVRSLKVVRVYDPTTRIPTMVPLGD